MSSVELKLQDAGWGIFFFFFFLDRKRDKTGR